MKSKVIFSLISLLMGATLVLAQAPARGRGPAQPQGAREVTVTEIPGVVAAGARWTQVWQGTDYDDGAPVPEANRLHGGNADGIVGTPDGGLLFAEEQSNQVRKLDKNGKVSVYIEDTHGTGAVAVDAKGRVLGAERTCTDPATAAQCTEPTAVAEIYPERKILADNIAGKSLGRLGDLIVDKKGGVYFNGGGTFYVNPRGEVSSIGENIRTNGLALSRDEKTLYVTNGSTIVAFDVQPDGTVKNQREIGKLEAGGNGDGMTIDAAGRLYVSTGPGVQVLSPEGSYLGVIPTPRGVVSVAFSGPGKKTLYMVGGGALGRDGKEFTPPEGIRNNAKTIYKLPMLAEGFKGRAK